MILAGPPVIAVQGKRPWSAISPLCPTAAPRRPPSWFPLWPPPRLPGHHNVTAYRHSAGLRGQRGGQ